tara:strand:- start:4200 stop:4868 length:669 start_codon:yes stop_codon:yes gene_type:complete
LESYYILAISSTNYKIGNYVVYTNSDADGYGAVTVKDAISCFKYFAQNRCFENALEWCCGPGYFGFASLHTNLASKISFSDVSKLAISLVKKTITTNNLQCKTYLSDNFKSIPKQQFDLIIANPPHFNLEIPDHRTDLVLQKNESRKMQDLDWKVHEDFFNNVNNYLTDTGKIMLMENMNGSTPDTFKHMLESNSLEITNFSPSAIHKDIIYYLEISKKNAG